jgi:hypothetical protein
MSSNNNVNDATGGNLTKQTLSAPGEATLSEVAARPDRGHNAMHPAIPAFLASLFMSMLFIGDLVIDHASAQTLGVSGSATLAVAALASLPTLLLAHGIGIKVKELRYGTITKTGAAVLIGLCLGDAAIVAFVSCMRALVDTFSTGSLEIIVGNTTPPPPTPSTQGLILLLQIGVVVAACAVSYLSHTPFAALFKDEKKERKAVKLASIANEDVAALLAKRARVITSGKRSAAAHYEDAAANVHRAKRWFLRILPTELADGQKLADVNFGPPTGLTDISAHIIATQAQQAKSSSEKK